MADRWIIEIVLDTGQRYQSADIEGATPAARAADDMAARTRVVAVTMIQVSTGEAITQPSLNLMAGRSRYAAREALAEALA